MRETVGTRMQVLSFKKRTVWQRSHTRTLFGNGAQEGTLEKTKYYMNAGDFLDSSKVTAPFFPLVFSL